ncbi:hypothetical protein C5167_008929 [Papaver somniferum]|uniref:Uncharacterized protein n=1 Tax=Papaver somniferum TaxID=3469 RepID=A0A4Y7JVW0_PAPSO|nr:hypothetical protein C5167_008929 [Papaver somniferum]
MSNSVFHSSISFYNSSGFRNPTSISTTNRCINIRSLSNTPIRFLGFSSLCISNKSPPKSAMTSEQTTSAKPNFNNSMNLLFVEMGVGYDQHGQDITSAAMRACKDAISSNSIPAFRRGSIPGVNFDQMKLEIKLGVPRAVQQSLDIERVKSATRLIFGKDHPHPVAKFLASMLWMAD